VFIISIKSNADFRIFSLKSKSYGLILWPALIRLFGFDAFSFPFNTNKFSAGFYGLKPDAFYKPNHCSNYRRLGVMARSLQ
jgi:hypothetical protein